MKISQKFNNHPQKYQGVIDHCQWTCFYTGCQFQNFSPLISSYISKGVTLNECFRPSWFNYIGEVDVLTLQYRIEMGQVEHNYESRSIRFPTIS